MHGSSGWIWPRSDIGYVQCMWWLFSLLYDTYHSAGVTIDSGRPLRSLDPSGLVVVEEGSVALLKRSR